MPPITLEGEFSRSGIAGDPVVLIDSHDKTRLDDWWKANAIFTKIFSHQHPTTRVTHYAIYISKSTASPFQEGDHVSITIEVRPEKRGNGIKIIQVAPR